MKKHRKTKVVIIVISSVLLGLILLYFGGSVIATSIICNYLFGSREPDIETVLKDPQRYYQILKTRDDYSLLSSREEPTFKHGKYNLQGYLYECSNPKGLIISCHGVSSFADSDHAEYQNYFLNQGWDIFSFDMPGCGRSEGDKMYGLYESRFAVESAIRYVKTNDKIKNLPLCLIGHSWGAYGAVTSSEIDEKIHAIAAISGYNAPNEMMVGAARIKYWDGLIIGKPGLDFALSILDGNKAFFKASSEIKKHEDISYYIIHGEKDDIVPFKGYSQYSKVVNINLNNVKTLSLSNYKHSGIWRSEAANTYYEIKKNELDALYKQYNKNIPDDVYSDFIASVDKDKSSELNLTLLDDINNLFTQSIAND